jgi:hypothetical protein
MIGLIRAYHNSTGKTPQHGSRSVRGREKGKKGKGNGMRRAKQKLKSEISNPKSEI